MLKLKRWMLLIFLTAALKVIASNMPEEGYVNVGDGNIYYQKFGPTFANPILILHGGPGLDSSYLLPQMTELAKDYQVIFYDQRGSGKSLDFALDNDTINIDKFTNDIEELRKHFGCNKIIILGHSWGGILAMHYATKHPENVSSLILFSSGPSTATEFKIFLNEYNKRMQPIQGTLDKITNTEKFKQGDPHIFSEFYRTIFTLYFYDHAKVEQLTLKFTKQSALNGLAVNNLLETNYLQKYDLRENLAQLKMPILIVHGANDIIPVKMAYEIKKHIKGAKLEVLKKCDHFAYIEQPQKFFKIVTSFIKSYKTKD